MLRDVPGSTSQFYDDRVVVEFKLAEDDLVFKLDLCYERQHKIARVNTITDHNAALETDPRLASLLQSYILGNEGLVSLVVNFNLANERRIIGANAFPELIKVQVNYEVEKEIILTKSLTKLQDSFTTKKFSIIRLS